MKKVLVLVAAMLLVAANAMAFSSIEDSKHNLISGIAPGVTGTTEICVFCHTPHGANMSADNAPLWNRTVDITGFTIYNSTTVEAASRPNTIGQSGIAATDAPLCLSCHDGSSIVDGLVNPPNNQTLSFTGVTMAANTVIGMDLSNDHPIGMNYNLVYASDDTGGANFVAVPSGINLFNNAMWCSSCHDVHSDSNYPFLAKSNAGSALCLSCHVK